MERISKTKIKFFASFGLKKNRDAYKMFTVEGKKSVIDFVESGVVPEAVIGSEPVLRRFRELKAELFYAEEADLKKISQLKTNTDVIAVFKQFESDLSISDIAGELIVFLDGVQNPGNLGTIIRTSEWFGVKHIVCSTDTVDVYNPKVVQATMGSLARVSVNYENTGTFLKSAKENNIEVYGAYAEGKNIYESEVPESGVIVFGNEGQGIRPENEMFVSEKISIPRFSSGKKPESLNVATAVSLVISEFRRKQFMSIR